MSLNEISRYTAATSSLLLRFFSYAFLRWVNNDLTYAPDHRPSEVLC